MTYNSTRLLLACLCLLLSAAGRAQRHEILNSRISTLQVVSGNDWLSPPVTTLGGAPIHISFDDQTHDYHRYTYRIEHCEADWSVSEDLFTSDYIDGFIPNDFRVQPTFLDELVRMISIHVTANFLSKPHKEAA